MLIAKTLHFERYPWLAELPTTGFEATPSGMRLLVLSGPDVDGSNAKRLAHDWLPLEASQAVACHGVPNATFGSDRRRVTDCGQRRSLALNEWYLKGQTQHSLVIDPQAEWPLTLRDTARGG